MRGIFWGVAAFCAIEAWIAIMVALVENGGSGRAERAAVSFAIVLVLAVIAAVSSPKGNPPT